RDVDGVDRALEPDSFGEDPGERAGARSDVGDVRTGTHAGRFDDLMPIREDLATFALEALDESLHVECGVEEVVVDARFDARFFGDGIARLLRTRASGREAGDEGEEGGR